MHSRGFRTSDPHRNTMGQTKRDVTTCFYAFSDIPKTLKFCMKMFNILVIIMEHEQYFQTLSVMGAYHFSLSWFKSQLGSNIVLSLQKEGTKD